MKLFTKNVLRNLALAMLGAAALSACGGAGSCANCNTASVVTTPQLSSEVPAEGAVNVSLAASVSITFDEPMDVTTLVAANFQLQKVSDSSYVTLTSPVYSLDGKAVTFVTSSGTADPALVSNSQYQIIIPVAANVKNAKGTPLRILGTHTDIDHLRCALEK